MDFKQIKTPTDTSKLWKDECCYCFDTPETGEGLFIDLKSLLSFSKKYLEINYQKTKNQIYLNYKKVATINEKVTSPKVEDDSIEKPPKKLAIGVEGGFNAEDEEVKYEEHYKLFLYPSEKYIELTDVPMNVIECCEKIKTMNSQSRKEEIVSWNAESVFPSAYAESIIQMDNTGTNKKVINPKGPWKCDVEGCAKVENLWLNLTDGFIACGRKYADGTGGNGHAQEHYDLTQYPISVKLGTITKDHADVYSYPEGDMVADPLLSQHLAHWGLNPNIMTKSEKSMAELELDQNLNFEFGKIQEKGKLLENVFGPGLTGIENLGNSCYMSSVIQMIFSIDSFQNRYLASRDTSFKDITQDPTASFEIQMSKLAHGLLSGEYSVPLKNNLLAKNQNEESETATQIGIAPKMFKSLVGANHPEFSTMKQQDAHEYLQYLLEFIDRSERSRPSWIQQENPTKIFQFYNEDRIECGSSAQVKYTRRLENILSVPVSMDDATNKKEVKEYEEKLVANNGVREKDQEEVRPIIPLISCINGFIEPYKVDDFKSPATNSTTFSLNSSRMSTFPDLLAIHLKKYTYNADYTPKKLNVFMDVPDVIDINHIRGNGIKEGEIPFKEGNSSAADLGPPTYNQEVLDTLLGMDFPLVRCKKALAATGGKDVEQAMNWIFEHAEDHDIDIEPTVVTAPQPQSNTDSITYNNDDIKYIIGMGFSEAHAKLALKNTQNNLERAADWIFSHIDNLEELVAKDKSSSSAPASQTTLQKVNDGSGKYELLGFISHLGNNVQHGHYVCHIKKNGKWIKFNDRHVQLSENPPKELGYIYFYKRQQLN